MDTREQRAIHASSVDEDQELMIVLTNVGFLARPDLDDSHTTFVPPNRVAEVEYGWFYAANIIEQWTRPAGTGVDLIWNASTWDPYRVILLRTHLEP